MAKRIYFESLKKWLIGSGITVGTENILNRGNI